MPIPAAVSLISALAPVVGSGNARRQSQHDIAYQNAYNHPTQQIKRLNEAGLPYAALTNQSAGNQSALPQTNNPGEAVGQGISNYITTQTQMKQLEILKEEARLKRSEANKNEAETEWLLSGQGETVRPSNLTSNLKAEQDLKVADAKGKQFANQIVEAEAGNIQTKIGIENTRAMQEIGKLIDERNLSKENLKGAKLENKIKNVVFKYSERMTDAQLQGLLLENGFKATRNDLEALRYKIEKATEEATIMQRDSNAVMSMLNLDRVRAEFDNYQQYHQFVQTTQDYINQWGPKDWLNPMKSVKAAIALAYTSVTGLSGSSPQGMQLLNYVK